MKLRPNPWIHGIAQFGAIAIITLFLASLAKIVKIDEVGEVWTSVFTLLSLATLFAGLLGTGLKFDAGAINYGFTKICTSDIIKILPEHGNRFITIVTANKKYRFTGWFYHPGDWQVFVGDLNALQLPPALPQAALSGLPPSIQEIPPA